jgi:hypothetical protein
MKDFNTFKKLKNVKLRNIEKMNFVNDGNRSLSESVVIHEVLNALEDFKSNNILNCVLIGGVALSFYVKPRATMDVDFLFLSYEDIPDRINKFKRHRKGAFQHNKTHVEVEVVTPQSINLPFHIAETIFNTSIIIDNIKIASPSGLVASKLFRFNRQDQADIDALIECSKIDLEPFNLPDEQLEKFKIIMDSMI